MRLARVSAGYSVVGLDGEFIQKDKGSFGASLWVNELSLAALASCI